MEQTVLVVLKMASTGFSSSVAVQTAVLDEVRSVLELRWSTAMISRLVNRSSVG